MKAGHSDSNSNSPEDTTKWMQTIVAFANGAGGKFVIGVNNKRELIGIPKTVDLFELKDGITDSISQMCEPQIMFDVSAETVENVQLMTIQVYQGNATPYFIKSLGKHEFSVQDFVEQSELIF